MGYQYHPDDMHIFRAVAATKAKGVSMTPEEILQGIQQRAAATLNASVVTDPVIRERVDYVCRCMSTSINQEKIKMSQFTSLEMCAGAGGQAIGLEMAGFDHAALVELEPAACATLRLNRPAWNVIEDDLRRFDGRPYQGIDLVAGRPIVHAPRSASSIKVDYNA